MESTVKGFELSPLQKRIWRLTAQGHRLFTLAMFRLPGIKELKPAHRYFTELLESHEIFNTRYESAPQLRYPFQVPGTRPLYKITELDLSLEEREMQQVIVDELYEELSNGTKDAGYTADLYLVKTCSCECTLLVKVDALSGDAGVIMQLVSGLLLASTGNAEENDIYPYTQYADWQQELQNEREDAADKFWAQRSNITAHYQQLPFSLQVSTQQINTLPEVLPVTLTNTDQEAISKYCNQENVSEEVLVKTAWALLLADYLDYPPYFIVGNCLHGRHYEAFASISGLFAKTLPFRVSISKEDPISTVLEKVMEETEAVNSWQDHYFNIPEDNSDAGTFDLQFEYQQWTPAPTVRAKSTLQRLLLHTEPSKLKLLAYRTNSNVGLQVDLYYHPSVLSATEASVINTRLVSILRALVKRNDVTVSDLREATVAEKAALPGNNTTGTNSTAIDQTIPAYFEANLELFGEKMAAGYKNKEIDYNTLNEVANGYAHCFINKYGVRPGDVVAFQLPRNISLIQVMLGILKTGAAFLPLDLSLPEERLKFILADSKAKVLVTQSEAPATVTAITPNWSLDGGVSAIAGQGSNPNVVFSSSSPAYLIYTSGSTGKPKGVLVSHAALLNYSRWFADTYQVTADDKSVLFSSIAFDLGFTNLWPVLLSGGLVYLQEETQLLDTQELFTLIDKKNITLIKLTPSHYNLLLHEPGFVDKIKTLSLRLIVLGGEEPRPAEIEKYMALQPSITFVNHYGPTETTIGTASKRITIDTLPAFQQLPVIGATVTNNQIFILDEQRRILPLGSTGEIVIAGKGLANGYLNQPALTEEKFITHPDLPVGRLYTTGDLGRYTLQGDVQFLGRKDFQVKVRGYRIELEEIRNVLLEHPDITEAAVLYHPGGAGDGSLAAYFSAVEVPGKEALQTFLAKHLPQYMIPGYFIPVPNIPLTPNGKIDRKQLYAIPLQKASDTAYVAPENEVEQQIAAIWKDLLNVERVGIHDNFFDLGGNSLKLILMLRELSKIFPQKVTLTDLFRYNTIASIIEFLGAGKTEKVAAVASFEI